MADSPKEEKPILIIKTPENDTKKEKTVLIVEDEGDIQQLIAMRLKASHFKILTASDGEEALAMIRDKKPDLIVLDLMLPKITGYELCQMIKFDEALKSIPIVVLSALEQRKDADRAFEAGADAYFVKPLVFDLLITKINQLLQ
ncbi:MAG: response regulator [Candidatus Omnitrophota bacterium]